MLICGFPKPPSPAIARPSDRMEKTKVSDVPTNASALLPNKELPFDLHLNMLLLQSHMPVRISRNTRLYQSEASEEFSDSFMILNGNGY